MTYKKIIFFSILILVSVIVFIFLNQSPTETSFDDLSINESEIPESLELKTSPPVITSHEGDDLKSFLESDDPVAKILRDNSKNEKVNP